MPAKILDGKAIAQSIIEELKQEVINLKKQGVVPGLAVILVGENPASKVYVKNKAKACENLGIYSETLLLPESTSQNELLKLIDKLNQDNKIHGILVQLPLPNHLNTQNIMEHILPEKDVDGFHPVNLGKLVMGEALFPPCTPQGIMEILKRTSIKIQGAEAVIVGRSNIVGKPVALMLLQENATVCMCHSKTKNLEEVTRRADILVVAIGRAEMIKASMVKKGAIVIDVGINRLNDKLAGDVDFKEVSKVASEITPVPGGVGPLTIAMLMKNTLKSAKLRNSTVLKI
ncbi:MAG: bifunctional methylenetetrahydrofolate dehydrogenase/methenyltetrahydrofolate cyclohydrolase FolD [Armatimonadetes bacterium]|nr:bifunctional methylenetetrahydrofolate dehydrogenase/methenyltetrahydrofolate cyclohydrolase FolD [Armatimonadota bacterium]